MMSRTSITKFGRVTARAVQSRNIGALALTRSLRLPGAQMTGSATARTQMFSTSPRFAKPLAHSDLENAKEANISDSEYHTLADEYLDDVLTRFEKVVDKTGSLDVEFSAGVMTIHVAGVGDWVINKQPPNKQIWLSSPKSGPKRFNWVIISEDQSSKQDTATGGWLYLKDGTWLNELLHKELGVDMDSTFESSAD